jgi:hypothetical protein
MADVGEHESLRDLRMHFQYLGEDDFIGIVEQITRRKVRAFVFRHGHQEGPRERALLLRAGRRSDRDMVAFSGADPGSYEVRAPATCCRILLLDTFPTPRRIRSRRG